MLVSFPLTTSSVVLAPEIARLHAQNHTAALQRLLTRSTLLTLLPAGLAALVLVLGGRLILGSVFGPAFEAASGALAILAIGQLFNSAAGPVGLFLSMTGHEKDALNGIIMSAVLNLVLNAVLIPPFGIVGSAIATAFSYLMWNLLLAFVLYRRLNLVAGPFAGGLPLRAPR
jgi:O-antigen/teichoic acid export membrane protein